MTESDLLFLANPIVTIDIETLDLLPTGAIYEVGMVITNILPKPGIIWSVDDLREAGNYGSVALYRYVPSLTEQMLMGRTVSEDTVQFHVNRCKKIGMDFLHTLEEDQKKHGLRAREIFQDMERCIKAAKAEKEVWFNHPQFDVTRLESWWAMAGIVERPWHYQAEADIASIVRMYRKQCLYNRGTDRTKSMVQNLDKKAVDSHTGLGDCCYNLAMLSTTGCYEVRGEN